MMKSISGVRRAARTAAVAVALAVAATTTTTLTGPTVAASAPDPACPAAFPVDDLVDSQPVTGLTVSKGTTPDPFSGEVLGVLNDGIGPGIDMIMVTLTSPEIERVEGIWAGMSGSPVYAADGRLIGAVSYGLSFGPSPVAGVTPAAAMQSLLSATPGAGALGAPAKSAEIPKAQQREMVAEGEASAREAGGGFDRLPVPLGLSGWSQRSLGRAAKILGLEGVRLFKAGAVSAAAAETPIVPGGNLAASLSYGDLSAVGVGTATAVCGGEVLAFGHPMTWSGPSSLTMHGADAIYIQKDPTLFPFKVANATAPVGTVDQDRLAALHGVLGQLPQTTRVDSLVSMDTGGSRAGTTMISVPDAVPDIGALALLVNQDRVFDGIGKGSARVRWTVSGTTGNGAPFEYSRLDHFANTFDASFEPVFDILDQLWLLHNNDFRAVTIENISYHSRMSREVRMFNANRLQRKVNGVWRPVNLDRQMVVKAGRTLRLRVVMTSHRNTLGTRKRVHEFPVPGWLRDRTPGVVQVVGGNSAWGTGGANAKSFDGMLDGFVNAPRNDKVTTRLVLFKRSGGTLRQTRSSLIGSVVNGGFDVPVLVRR